jgi:hypothetical protein
LRTHLAELHPRSLLWLPNLHGITCLCSTAGLFAFKLRMYAAKRAFVQQLTISPPTCASMRQDKSLSNS